MATGASTQFGGTVASLGVGPSAVEMSSQPANRITVHGAGGDALMAAASAPPAFAKVDEIEDHILRPNARNQLDIVERVNNKASTGMGCGGTVCCIVGCCGLAAFCCGRYFRTGVGLIDLWLDSNKKPIALGPNTWQLRPNFLEEKLGSYDMSSGEPFSRSGVCIAKIEAGSVYFANQGGQPVMIAAKERPGWYVTVDPGFSFAREILVDGQRVFGCRAKLSSSYINFESLHLFNVQPNSVHIVSRYLPGVGSQFEVLPPGSHSFSSPFMKSTAVIPTSIQDVIIVEDRVSTQDGIGLSNCKAVLSYQIKLENVRRLLDLDVQNYREVIQDWAKRTMLHEIGNTDYVSHSAPAAAGDNPGQSPAGTGGVGSSMSSVLGSRGPSAMPGAGVRSPESDGENFRPALEHHMRKSLEHSLTPYGVQVLTFALQSFDPPAQLVSQVTIALAKRTEAQYQFQAAQIQNQTLLAAAETEAQAIQTRAAAVAKAANMTASVPHARALQVLDKQVEIARAWSNGNAKTLVLQGGGSGGLPFASISEMAQDEGNK